MKSRILFEFGEMLYELEDSWLKMPHILPTMQVAGVACTSDDHLYALTRNHEHPIMHFDENGVYIETIGAHLQFGSEHGLSVTKDDCLWVCDSDRHLAYKLTRRGEVLMRLGTPDVPCRNGFDPEVPYPHNLYTVTCAGAPFNRPTGAMEAPDGTVWVCDGYGNASLHHFSRSGEWIRTVGGPGRGQGQFRLPHAVWVDTDGVVWVADRDNQRVMRFDDRGDPLGEPIVVYPVNSPYGPSTLWGDGVRVFCSMDSRGLMVFDQKSGSLTGLIEAPEGSHILTHSVCGDSRGNLYFGSLHPEPMVTRLRRIR